MYKRRDFFKGRGELIELRWMKPPLEFSLFGESNFQFFKSVLSPRHGAQSGS